MIQLVRAIDKFTDTTGMWIAWLNIPLVLAVAYEVIARYFFHAPTIWSFDVTYMLYGTIFMLGAAFALHKGAHIRTDFFYENWTRAHQGHGRFDLLPGVLLPVAHPAARGERQRGLVRLDHQRDLRADAVAADPLALQDAWCR